MLKVPEIVDKVAAEVDAPKTAVEQVVRATFNAIADSLVSGEGTDIYRFGKFTTVHKDATTARNPKTGKPVQVPAKNVPKFHFSTSLQDRVKAGE